MRAVVKQPETRGDDSRHAFSWCAGPRGLHNLYDLLLAPAHAFTRMCSQSIPHRVRTCASEVLARRVAFLPDRQDACVSFPEPPSCQQADGARRSPSRARLNTTSMRQPRIARCKRVRAKFRLTTRHRSAAPATIDWHACIINVDPIALLCIPDLTNGSFRYRPDHVRDRQAVHPRIHPHRLRRQQTGIPADEERQGRGRLPAHGPQPARARRDPLRRQRVARAAGRTLAAQRDAIPVFIRIATDAYRFVGQYVVSESLTAPLDCAPYVRNSSFTPGQISRVLKLKRC